MSITERAKDMGVEELVKENRRLKDENKNLKKELKKVEEDQMYWYYRCMKVERALNGDTEED